MLRKTLYKAAGRLIHWRNRLLKPTTFGVRALIVNDAGEILLVRHSYGTQWYLPGGGHSGAESILACLGRELEEELGLSFDAQPSLLGVYANHFEYKRDFIAVFVLRHFTLRPRRSAEIDAAQFFAPTALPEGVSPGTRRRIQEYYTARQIDFVW